MNMMYLLIQIYGGAIIAPEQYSESQCESIVRDIQGKVKFAICIPAPRINIMKDPARFGECKMINYNMVCPLKREDEK